MNFLAQAIADLIRVATFQQRQAANERGRSDDSAIHGEANPERNEETTGRTIDNRAHARIALKKCS
jgi:hypothetical protein